MKYDTQTRRQRAEDLTNEVMQYLGAREVAKIFRGGEPDYGIEPVERPDVLGIISTTPKTASRRKRSLRPQLILTQPSLPFDPWSYSGPKSR